MFRINRSFSNLLQAETNKNNRRVITLINSKKRNILDKATLQLLIKQIDEAQRMPGIQAVEIRNLGPMFSSGHDLKEIKSDTSCFDLLKSLCLNLANFKMPIAAVVGGGHVNAAGFQLFAACKYKFATKDTKFTCSGIKYGLFCATPAVEVARRLPQKVAMQLLLTGQPIFGGDKPMLNMLTGVADTQEKLEEMVRNYKFN